MRTPAKSPRPEEVSVEVSPYSADPTGDVRSNPHQSRPVARVWITGPNGERASAFLSVGRDSSGRWVAEVSHDATDYSTERPDYRRAGVRLRFFNPSAE